MLLNLSEAGDTRLVEAGTPFGLDDRRDGRGLAAADYDLDGDVDLAMNNYEAEASFFDNQMGHKRAWIAVRVQGVTSNRDGIGAEVIGKIRGKRDVVRLVGAGHGYAGQYSLEQILGLGDSQRVDDLRVRWPTGRLESFGAFDAGQRLRLIEGQGKLVADARDAREAAGPPASSTLSWWGIALGGFVVVLLAWVVHLATRRRKEAPHAA